MISLLKKTFLFLTILTFGTTLVSADSVLKLEALPRESVAPLEGESCGCILFAREGPLTKDKVLFSIKSSEGPAWMRVKGKTLSLVPRPSKTVKKTWVNEYHSPEIQVKIESRAVSYQKFCGRYPEPPSEGSCFLGTLKVNSGAESVQQEVVELCGC